VIGPIQLDFIVRCTAAEAFDTWTKNISVWWPSQHTRSRERGTTIVIEPDIGGRIFERTSTGEEFHWGSVTAWDRPERFAYRWHITSPPDEATEVDVRFADTGDGTTRVTISHTGFDRLGGEGPPRRSANLRHWETLIPAFVRACETAESQRP
jgi:hypothetical protein